MQIIICSKRQYVASKRLAGLLLKYNSNKSGIFNITSKNVNFSSQVNRLCFPLLHQKCEDIMKVRSMVPKRKPNNGYYVPKLCSTRSFSTTSTNCQHPSNKSSKDSDKDSKNSHEHDIASIKISAIVSVFILAMYMLLEYLRVYISDVSWDDFIHELLLKGQVQQILISERRVQVLIKSGATFKGRQLNSTIEIINIPDIQAVESKIRTIENDIGIRMEDGIPIRYTDSSETDTLIDILGTIGMIVLIAILLRSPNIANKFNLFGDLRKAKFTLVEPFSGKGVRFKDVAGLKEAKVEVMEFVDYLKNSDRYKKLGAKVPKGALLLGPPGCGKTLLAKAVATESNVPFLSMNGSEFIEIVGGLGAVRVRNLFAEARKRSPSIIYIDEIDAIGKKRTDSYNESSSSESERTLNQLLVEMDGMTTVENIIILASTNRPDVLDKALLRRGRFDRHILIDLPTLEEREQIFEYHLKSLSLKGQPLQYAKYLSHLTPGFSGAEIANVCNEAALHAANEKKVKVDNDDLMYSIDKIIGGTVKKSSTLTPSEKEVVVYHEAGHALVAWLSEHVNPLIKVTVVPRTNKRLGFAQYSDSNVKLQSAEHLFERMCVLLGGRVAENIIFKKISTGAQNDLKKVTEIAYHKVQQFGMSPSVGLVSFDKEITSTKTKKPYSKKLGSLMDAEVRRIITEAYKTTEKLLRSNNDKLIKLAEALLKQETLSFKDIEALIGPPPFGKKDIADLHDFNTHME